ncbi:XTP/dITP diphosphohydrolase [Pseudidiomarina planktonica]|uniref:dITP/XTP pyrophosphatase n=1 Tax=Pseudidiomarina planktonica TaxID=1323738 RepID=A0A1Y6FY00_9GAMM|nr:RdgB/HAM1 family non-canonical purine NTP pyrophosphatase [Pseudidiomarina planktonica]RUO62920.1 non-canonical purine NTP pyrophosphatase, RdgB/HAM1 family [Pseudidiomarina planktonica]SMQ80810.1 XTP/dITP diphosphohydrolase [Pseudidiomarina planktonica]
MRELVLATGNQGKVKELQNLLAAANWQVKPQSHWQLPEAEETGTTFVENAIIKARHAARLTGLPAIADDSGLAVSALGGAPGVYSARYAGADATDNDNVTKLLDALAKVPESERQACFHCVLVYLAHADDPTPLICHGQWHGEIATATSGKGGFGYDPVFFVQSDNCTAAELEPSRKHELSHRGQALRELLSKLESQS